MPQSFQVPVTTYTSYELSEADEWVLALILNLSPSYTLHTRGDGEDRAQKVAAIKWWRARFNCGLKEAKDAVDFYHQEATKEAAEEVSDFKLIGFIANDDEDQFCRYHDGEALSYAGRDVYIRK